MKIDFKTIIDTNGNIVDLCVMFVDGQSQYFKMQEEYIAVKQYKGNFIKPNWNGTKWIEGATEEEIQAWQEENKIIKQPTTEEEILKQIADLKIDNMKKDTIINNTLKTVAELKVKVMSMKGGN